MALKDREAFYGRLSRRMEKQYLADTDSLKREYESLAGRNQEIDDTFIPVCRQAQDCINPSLRFYGLCRHFYPNGYMSGRYSMPCLSAHALFP